MTTAINGSADLGVEAHELAEELSRSRGLLRFATAGSVDDGKSTLVGRLLHDSKSVLSDQLERSSARRRRAAWRPSDLSLLVDGLRAEREQGITIDVAYRYFATPARTFILADTPGHVQYTRNTVTGASTADLVVVLVDARTGVVAQTRRHAAVAALLGVPHLLLAVNKIDLVDYDEAVFDAIAAEFDRLRQGSGHRRDHRDPDLGAERGQRGDPVRADRLVRRAQRAGAPGDGGAGRPVRPPSDLRFPVQYVIRPRSDELPDYRGYAGRVAAGTVRPGDEVVVLPSGRRTTVTGIDTADGPREVAVAGDSVTLLLADDVDLSRGDLIAAGPDARAGDPVHRDGHPARRQAAANRALRTLLRYGTTSTRAIVTSLDHLLDIGTLTYGGPPESLALNDIAQVTIRTADPVPVEAYRPGGAVGSLLIIDPADGTSLAGRHGRRPARRAAPPDHCSRNPRRHRGGLAVMSRHEAIHLERCPQPACTGRAYPLTPSNAHTPGP